MSAKPRPQFCEVLFPRHFTQGCGRAEANSYLMLMLFFLAVSAQTISWIGNRRRGNRLDGRDQGASNENA